MGFVNEQQRLTNQKNHIFFHSFVHFTSWRLHFPYFFHFCVPYCRFEFLVRWSVNAWVFFEKSLSEFFFSLCVVSSVQCTLYILQRWSAPYSRFRHDESVKTTFNCTWLTGDLLLCGEHSIFRYFCFWRMK